MIYSSQSSTKPPGCEYSVGAHGKRPGASQMVKILVVEDDRSVSRMICDCLESQQYDVEAVSDGNEASDRLRLYDYDLIMLDVEIPDRSGFQVCKDYRSAGGTTPILMLTGRKAIEDKELGLDLGADDYLTKPFHSRELLARVRALLRRPATMTAGLLEAGDLKLDSVSREVTLAGVVVSLKPREFALLEFFMRFPNQVFSNEDILNRVWVSESDSTPQAVRTCVQRIRDKIDRPGVPSLITTVHRIGYKFEI